MPDAPDAPARPLLAPWVTRDAAGPMLMYADAGGRVVRLRLTALDLARLGLTLAETQAAAARCDLNGAVQTL